MSLLVIVIVGHKFLSFSKITKFAVTYKMLSFKYQETIKKLYSTNFFPQFINYYSL